MFCFSFFFLPLSNTNTQWINACIKWFLTSTLTLCLNPLRGNSTVLRASGNQSKGRRYLPLVSWSESVSSHPNLISLTSNETQSSILVTCFSDSILNQICILLEWYGILLLHKTWFVKFFSAKSTLMWLLIYLNSVEIWNASSLLHCRSFEFRFDHVLCL